MSQTDHGLYGRSFNDVYDDWYRDLDDPTHLVAALAERCKAGSTIVELGSGTGRLATPIDEAGYCVIAVDISHAMLGQAPTGPDLVAADMTELALRSQCAHVAILAYNTLFNAPSLAGQQRCFDEAARVLAAGGVLAVEAFVAPADAGAGFGLSSRAHPGKARGSISILTGPHATAPGVIVGAHIESGATRTCRPWQLLYQTPAALDACAQRAGLALDVRYGSWSGSAFDADCDRHVSWYKRV